MSLIYRKTCPCCGHRISWMGQWRFSSTWGTRVARPCLHCGKRIRWAPRAWRLTTMLAVAFILTLIPALLLEPFSPVPMILQIPIAVGMLIAARSLHFERAELEDKS